MNGANRAVQKNERTPISGSRSLWVALCHVTAVKWPDRRPGRAGSHGRKRVDMIRDVAAHTPVVRGLPVLGSALRMAKDSRAVRSGTGQCHDRRSRCELWQPVFAASSISRSRSFRSSCRQPPLAEPSLVLPHPPAPVSVTRREDSTSARTGPAAGEQAVEVARRRDERLLIESLAVSCDAYFTAGEAETGRPLGQEDYGPRPELRAAHDTSPEQPSATRSRSAPADSPGGAAASRPVAAMLPAARPCARGGRPPELVRREGPFDLESMRAWGADRRISAEALRHLLVAEQWQVHAKGVRLQGY